MARRRGHEWRGGRTVALLGIAIGMLAGSTAQADDVAPPEWSRSGPGAFYGHWELNQATNPSQPQERHNPFQGQPLVGVSGTAGHFETSRKGWGLLDTPPGVPPWLVPPGVMTAVIPNANRPGSKRVHIQVTFLGKLGKPRIDVPGFTKVPGEDGEKTFNADNDGKAPYSEGDGTNGWVVLLTKWTAPTCPASETITIKPPVGGVAKIDQLVVDTHCTFTVGGR